MTRFERMIDNERYLAGALVIPVYDHNGDPIGWKSKNGNFFPAPDTRHMYSAYKAATDDNILWLNESSEVMK